MAPGPGDYETDLAIWKKCNLSENPKYVMGKAYRKFDIIKYGSISKEII